MKQIAGELIVALVNELMTSLGLLKHGLAGLQAIDAGNDFYQLPLLLLANGSEKLCKCVLILKHQEDAGQFPDQAMLKRWGHDIEILTDSIIRTCYPVDYLKRQVAAEVATMILTSLARGSLPGSRLNQLGNGLRWPLSRAIRR